MGNDTIVAGGQSTQGNNVTVDGGYNSDDALGTSSGAQVRTPLEAIQEFQVLTSMYDAEFGRASGAVVNAITKSGTNQFKGVVFGEARQQQADRRRLFRPDAEIWSSQRRSDAIGAACSAGRSSRTRPTSSSASSGRSTTRTAPARFATRPSLTFSLAEDRTDWNTLIRYDHQINKNHTFAVRWLREWAPQWYTFGDRQTLDRTRTRPTSTRPRWHADQRARQRPRQHVPRRADVGALVARQRLLPHAGRERRPGRIQLRR